MAIEEEFSIEIPDKDADAIHSGKQHSVLNQQIHPLTQNHSPPGRRIHPEPA